MVQDQPHPQSDDERLDDLGLKVLQLMQQIVLQKLRLQEHLKSGSINLAKSRYIMGNRNVSASQLPTEGSCPFSALRKVELQKSEVHGVEIAEFALIVEKTGKKTKSALNEELKDCMIDSQISSDPLHWFGVLVPQNLRMAQESFKKAVEVSVEIANLQASLEAIRFEFCTLKLDHIKIS